ncbi:MAG: methyltransferase domain-containing protein [Chloroflexota bacterium]|nr:methyltransferase domain-containing protein [Chloroflexota bacterium]
MKRDNPYDERYAGQEYYWGKKPSAMCDRTIEIIRPSSDFRPKLLDLGCGEGRNAVYFAQHGFEVVGLDASLFGLEKTKRYAEEVRVHVETIHADIVDYQLKDTYDVIFSTGTLQYLPPEVRSQRFQDYKDCTSPDGINVLGVFVRKPFIPRAPDAEETDFPYQSGELMSYYWDWEILYCTEEIFDCKSSGVPHKHAVNRIIARRYRNDR